jgi:hypothetical protein
MAVRVLLEFAQPAMRLARPIFDADGKLIAGTGTQLDERMVRLLRRLALQTVVVEDSGNFSTWQTVTPVETDLAELRRRFQREQPSPALETIFEAVSRHLLRRAAALAQDPALAAQPDPDAPPTGEVA